jgi:ABC-type branched-subunit amino acid transport system substrate-binding protein
MTVSVVMTLVLGGAVVHELGRHQSGVSVASGSGARGQAAGTSDTVAGVAGPAAGASGSGAVAGTGAPGAGPLGASGGSGPSGPVGQLSAASVGVTGTTITVGGIFDETGPFDATVERDTVRAYFDMVNAQGGVNGHKLVLLDCDSGYDPSRAHQCSQQLLSQQVFAIVGWLSVSGEQAETQFFTQQGVPMVGGLGVPAEFQSPLSWPVADNLVTYGTAMGGHAKDLGIHAPGVVIVNAPFVAPVKDSLLASLHQNGIHEKSVDLVDPTKADYSDLALKLQSEGADSVIGGLDPFSYARMFQAFERQNYKPKVLGLGLDKSSANQQYGAAVHGAESLTPLVEPSDHMNDPNVALYYGTVRRYFPNQVPALDVYTEGEWVAAQTFVQALRAMGNQPVTRQSLANALNSIKAFQTGLTPPLSFSAGSSHDPNRCFQWIKNNNGVWTTYSGWNCF